MDRFSDRRGRLGESQETTDTSAELPRHSGNHGDGVAGVPSAPLRSRRLVRYSRAWETSTPSGLARTASTRSSTRRSKRVTRSRPAPTPTRSSRDDRKASNASRAVQTPDATWSRSTKTETPRCGRPSRDAHEAIRELPEADRHPRPRLRALRQHLSPRHRRLDSAACRSPPGLDSLLAQLLQRRAALRQMRGCARSTGSAFGNRTVLHATASKRLPHGSPRLSPRMPAPRSRAAATTAATSSTTRPEAPMLAARLDLVLEYRKPPFTGGFKRADDGTRTHDLLHGKQTL
jgi:hypothetical protein